MREFGELLGNRRREVDKHLLFIREVEKTVLNGKKSFLIEAEHVNILKSAFLVHLYNVVESVMTTAIKEITATAKLHPPPDWSEGLFRAWLAYRAESVSDLEPSRRVDRIVSVIAEASGRQQVGSVNVAKREGNWSNLEIETIATRLTCPLMIRDEVKHKACVRHFMNEMPPIKYVRHMRNQIAHGNLSFIDAGSPLSVDQLDSLRAIVCDYMEDVTSSFNAYLDNKSFLGNHGQS